MNKQMKDLRLILGCLGLKLISGVSTGADTGFRKGGGGSG